MLVGDGVKKEDVWSVKDGVLVCKGTPLGYLFTNEAFQDFTLTLEWRWAPAADPETAACCCASPVNPPPSCRSAWKLNSSTRTLATSGDFSVPSIEGDAARLQEIKDHKDLGNFKGFKKTKAAEKPPGEWNRYEITVSGGNIELKVNGETVNQASGLDVLAGPIGLQSEGAEIHFRNIELVEKPL